MKYKFLSAVIGLRIVLNYLDGDFTTKASALNYVKLGVELAALAATIAAGISMAQSEEREEGEEPC